jgi:hypothetical protein
MATTILRSYTHASNIFESDNASFLPKNKNWFLVAFELSTVALKKYKSYISLDVGILGVLVKTVKLPAVDLTIEKRNNYNRWDHVTTKLTYKPVDITFWDDNRNAILSLWYSYYDYMIEETNYVTASKTSEVTIQDTLNPIYGANASVYTTAPQEDGYGYGLDVNIANRTSPFFKSIRIFHISRANDSNGAQFTEHCLINPVISSFDPDTLDMSNADFTSIKMSIQYETIAYNTGYLPSSEIAEWEAIKSDNYYDTTTSPNSLATTLITASYADSVSSGYYGNVSSTSNNLSTTSTSNNYSSSSNSSVLSSATSSEEDLSSLDTSDTTSSIVSVPTVSSSYGTSGNPPSTSDTSSEDDD